MKGIDHVGDVKIKIAIEKKERWYDWINVFTQLLIDKITPFRSQIAKI